MEMKTFSYMILPHALLMMSLKVAEPLAASDLKRDESVQHQEPLEARAPPS